MLKIHLSPMIHHSPKLHSLYQLSFFTHYTLHSILSPIYQDDPPPPPPKLPPPPKDVLAPADPMSWCECLMLGSCICEKLAASQLIAWPCEGDYWLSRCLSLPSADVRANSIMDVSDKPLMLEGTTGVTASTDSLLVLHGSSRRQVQGPCSWETAAALC